MVIYTQDNKVVYANRNTSGNGLFITISDKGQRTACLSKGDAIVLVKELTDWLKSKG